MFDCEDDKNPQNAKYVYSDTPSSVQPLGARQLARTTTVETTRRVETGQTIVVDYGSFYSDTAMPNR